ncbi:MAG: proline--tRNA ligase [Gemmatimonadota bacterium]|nr:MAG: proline--tRNA ligase [Gemmatimonadota bacterium]
MKLSQAFIPTLKETPSDAEVASHRLMLRAGLIRPLVAGVYSYLPLGWRAMRKAAQIVREEIDRIGGQEFSLPTLSPKELWQGTGRYDEFGDLIFKLKDRRNRELCLAPTHEEVITDIARTSIRSFRDMPQLWYQIQLKHRDEFRPRSGVLRGRMFIMKDSYSLDADQEGLDAAYHRHREAYSRIFIRSGLKFFVVQASSGVMGGSESEEFMAPTAAGEDTVIRCSQCDYAANLEVAQSVPKPVQPLGEKGSRKVHTPDQRTIDEVSAFLGCRPENLMKSLLYIIEDKPVMILIRGDHELNENKLMALRGSNFRPAEADEALNITGANLGFLGPVGLKDAEILCDIGLREQTDVITGANEDDYHLVGLTPEKDFQVDSYQDLRHVKEGENCIHCGKPLNIINAIELGHIFKLGTKYSTSLGATFLDSSGEKKPIVMGSYGIGIERIIAAAIEQNHDEDGIIWPLTLAPYEVHILPIDMTNDQVSTVSKALYASFREHGLEVLIDDREESPGKKFKDADLIGFPFRINVGARSLKEGKVELKPRHERTVLQIDHKNALSAVKKMMEERHDVEREKLEKVSEKNIFT